ncbi:uncharacterized protein A4U43_C01F3290 [Asparagus officinalis]|uniref:Uncharacterized protein n=1 Tax=Asparagus officinalis TaxID=4686 RepID=A0A5P1FLD8_ASPOF|nr:probable beta-1,3-galactosyltransferase 14 [Asparagus officinalis]XP_020272239.1 probable beta-1,3-galactosyltransferase 14 [Asparagus officinalis]ONK79135.1 uncharacterized protein A4U43_C01F3290 [Asparagus officinalis]
MSVSLGSKVQYPLRSSARSKASAIDDSSEASSVSQSNHMFSNEDVTIGAMMLAMNVNHEDNRVLCSPGCTTSSIVVWDIPKCSGLCNPEAKMLKLHKREICSSSPTSESSDSDQ